MSPSRVPEASSIAPRLNPWSRPEIPRLPAPRARFATMASPPRLSKIPDGAVATAALIARSARPVRRYTSSYPRFAACRVNAPVMTPYDNVFAARKGADTSLIFPAACSAEAISSARSADVPVVVRAFATRCASRASSATRPADIAPPAASAARANRAARGAASALPAPAVAYANKACGTN